MDREKFQQKALKQTKQKKSKSAEFLMVKEDRDAAEGIGNPAFNMSSPDLSAYQTSEKNVIRYDMPDLTLAAHQRKLRLLTSAEPKGNEYSRNYFDPLMDEEINPRQYGMEVSREGERELTPLQVDDRILYDQLTKLLDESEQGEPSDGNVKEKTVDPEVPMGSSRSHELHIGAGEDIPSYIEEFEKYAQKDVILRSSSSLEQDLQFEGEGLNQHIPMSNLKTDKAFEKPQSHPLNANLNVCEEDMGARFGNCIEVTNESKGTAGPCWKVEQTQPLQPLQMQIKCLRGIKDKVPQGSYFLKVSLLSRLGSFVLQEWTTEQLKTRTHPIRHDGNFYNVGLYFNENLHLKLPPKKDVKPGMAFLFELFLLHENYACFDRVVGWAAFPLCNNNFDVVEGKFKCPLLRGSYDQKLSNFRTIEDLICLELDHWLCNLYFQVIKLPLHLDDQKHHERRIRLTPEFPPCFLAEAEKAESNLENTTGHSEKETKKSISASMDGHGRSFACFRQGAIESAPTHADLMYNRRKRGPVLHHPHNCCYV